MTAVDILQKYWGYDNFRSPQDQIIASVLAGKDTLAILPTGGGKSVCFQVPALLKKGVCLVISPLIALMQDQVNNLNSRGIKAIALAGNIPFDELERIFNNTICGAYQFLYLSPERLQNSFVQEQLKSMEISLIAIDEAHCISHWGKDFRPAYLECKYLKEWFPNVPMIALTASATPEIQQDIIQNLQMQQVQIIQKTLSRDNLAYFVYEVDDKHSRLERILLKNKGSSIIYVRNRKLTLELSKYLNDNGFSTTYYHGGLPLEEKNLNMSMWLLDDVQVMVATNAFGMGIDKPNVRTIIHWDLPASLEDYFQEAGRGGRDGLKAFAITLFNQNDIDKLQYFSQMSQISIDYLTLVYRNLCNYFSIAYGEGEGQTFVFYLADFTARYGLDTFQAYQALEVLDKNSVISLSQAFYRKATLRIISSSEKVRKYVEDNPSEKELLYYLMRTYTGIYEQIISFQVEKVAAKIGKPTSEVLQQLNHLNGTIIDYKAENTDAQITFLMPRNDEKTIYFIAPQVKWFNRRKKEQNQAVLDYMTSSKICKERYLLTYFGEKSEKNCGICSFCIEKKYKEEKNNAESEAIILNLLQENPLSSQEICLKIELPEKEILLILNKLVDNQKVKRNALNQYVKQ